MFAPRALAALTLSLFLTGSASAWWNSDWSVRKKVTIDPAAAGVTDAIGATPVLVRLFDGNFVFGSAKEDGSDLRFVAADDKTLLSFHVERYDSLLNEAYVWVKVPDLKPGAKTEIWLYSGNAGPKAVKADDAKATYDADTALVYHFSEKGAPANDASMNGNSAQAAGTPIAGSLIAGGVRFDGKTPLTIPASPSLAFAAGGALTWSAWIKPTALTPEAVLFTRQEGNSGLTIGLDAGVPFVEIKTDGNIRRSDPTVALPVNAWRHLALVVSGGTATLYVNGEPRIPLNASLPALNGPLLLGQSGPADPSAPAGFTGEMDELQISRTARAPGFLRVAAVGQGGDKDAKLLTFGADEIAQAWFTGGDFGIIIRNLTVDGWVVIVICVFMAIGSWIIMVRKAGYINSMKRGNEAFLKAWEQASDDLTALDSSSDESMSTLGGKIRPTDAKAMRNASIFRIYHIGAVEVRKRVGNGHGKVGAESANGSANGHGAYLSARSMQAIRASLDGGMVRETQKLNRLMVLLTICISGGPFLGLLGTVIGVMITFAAIANAGDVNVNAIAPGIAAALLATIAGLAVAIPALFGYNYLLTRIKETTSDMAVFIDEFVARMAEFYGGRGEA